MAIRFNLNVLLVLKININLAYQVADVHFKSFLVICSCIISFNYKLTKCIGDFHFYLNLHKLNDEDEDCISAS